ncbi:hypothetical protein Gohar_028366 [Gossypium harknessii]|uniref:Uncharacterized protein n=1 Tax=Gossypium harknessii TaxID=34285 RepID=A0A7J9IFT1_9ROSI|nr:hypothetical protein [Gossypium harknessii]
MYSPELNLICMKCTDLFHFVLVVIAFHFHHKKVLIHVQLQNRELVMEKGFLDQVENNATGYMSELWDFTHISVTRNNLQELKEIWDQWDDETKQLFYYNYGNLPYLLEVDLVPTVEEYTTLLRCSRIQVDKVYSRAANILTFLKRLMCIMRMIHSDTKKRVDVFAFSIYELVIFSKAILRELLSVERIRGYAKVRRNFKEKMDGNSPESPRRRR